MKKVCFFFVALLPHYGSGVRFNYFLKLREKLRLKKRKFLGMCLKSYLQKRYGCELGINAQISPKALFMHTVGVVIGDGAVVEDGVKIYSGVTLGRKNIEVDKYPIIKRNSILGCNCSILGDVIIEENCTIGANSVVINNCDIPRGVYAGIPAGFLYEKNCSNN